MIISKQQRRQSLKRGSKQSWEQSGVKTPCMMMNWTVTQEQEIKSSLTRIVYHSPRAIPSVLFNYWDFREQAHDFPAVSPAGKTSTRAHTQPDATREVSVLHHMMSVLAVVTKQNSTPVLSIRCFLDWSVVGSWQSSWMAWKLAVQKNAEAQTNRARPSMPSWRDGSAIHHPASADHYWRQSLGMTIICSERGILHSLKKSKENEIGVLLPRGDPCMDWKKN